MKNKIVLLAIPLLLIIGFIVYKNNNQDNNNISPQENLSSENTIIENYINENVLKPEFGGKVFCAFNKYGSEENNDKIYYYLWTYCEEYFNKDGSILMGSGVSMPVKLTASINENEIQIDSFVQPIDGEGYSKSIKNMFPENYALEAIKGFDINKFSQSPKQKAYEFFKIQ